MPAKSEKQKKFFGAVMGAKKGQSNVSGEAKKVAKELPKKEIKKFLKTEEDEQSISKQMKKTGKATIKGPQVKERKKFAPATKVEAPKKGKGSYNRTYEEPEEDNQEKKSCWKGYKKQGMKTKGGRRVNNCVKENVSQDNIVNFIDSILSKNYASANKYIKQAVESKLQTKIEQELSTPLF